MTNANDKKSSRERGTLKNTLPRKILIITSLICLVSAALASSLSSYSTLVSSDSIDSWKVFAISILGSVSALVGIIYGDSLSHSFAFGVSVLIAHLIGGNNARNDIIYAITTSLPPLIVTALASTKWSRWAVSSLGSDLILNSVTLNSCCVIPFLMLVLGPILSLSSPTFTTPHGTHTIIPYCFSVSAALVMFHLYNKTRAHKNGYLLSAEMKSHSVAVAIAILLSSSLTEQRKIGSAVIIIYLSGSLFTLLLGFIFGSVADTWYAVGSGQFQMVSLDTAGLLAYFVCPTVLLSLRFVDRYGTSIAAKATAFLQYWNSLGLLPLIKPENTDVLTSGLVLVLSVITAMGVPLLNSLCPIGGYLYSRAYTHGQPNTKKVALCVFFSDLVNGNELSPEIDSVLKMMKYKKTKDQKTGVLNVIVTVEDFTSFPSKLKELSNEGHSIALSLVESKNDIFVAPLFQTNQAKNELLSTYEDFCRLMGGKPGWFFAKSADGVNRHPATLRQANDLGMKVAYWSTHVVISDDILRDDQLNVIHSDLADKNGGSIVYITSGKKENSSRSVCGSLCEIFKVLSGDGNGKYCFESFSVVAKDDPTMVL